MSAYWVPIRCLSGAYKVPIGCLLRASVVACTNAGFPIRISTALCGKSCAGSCMVDNTNNKSKVHLSIAEKKEKKLLSGVV